MTETTEETAVRNGGQSVELGDRDADGMTVEILRGFYDGSEHTTTFLKYICHGVDDIDVQDPWNTGAEKNCTIGVTFADGSREYLNGVIVDVGGIDE